LTLVLATVIFSAARTNAQNKYLETVKVTDSIYVFKPKLDWLHGNGTAIIGRDAVFFIDTYQQTNYAEEAIRLLRKITPLPVKFVLNTHWHNDHVTGNYIFKKHFPNCQIIAQDSCYVYMAKIIKPAIDTEMKGNDAAVAQLQQQIKDGKLPNGTLLVGTMKTFWEQQVQEGVDYKKEYTGNKFTNADITFSDSLTFHWGSQTIRLIHSAPDGHSPGDVIAWIPEKRILIAGDLAVGPTPYATHDNLPQMVKAIQQVIDMKPAIIIPGHGVVEYDLTYIQLVEDAFKGYMAKAEENAKNKVPLKDALNNITLPGIDEKFYGDDVVKKWAYRAFFARNIIYFTYKHNGGLAKAK
jgi:cyclase